MRVRFIASVSVFLLSAVSLLAQTPDPSGHWEGVIQAPGMEVPIEVDLVRNAKGGLSGTFNNPSREIRGFPLANVAVDGTTVTFAIKADGGGTFSAALLADAQSMKGTFSTRGPDAQQHELPFELKRTGQAKIEAAPKLAAVSEQLAGTWAGTLEVEGQSRRIGLAIHNHPDGTATAAVITSGDVEIGITSIQQKGSAVTLDVQNIGGSYDGTLNPDGTELAGTWTQGAFVMPLTFRRAVK